MTLAALRYGAELVPPGGQRELRLKPESICKPIMVWDADGLDRRMAAKMKVPYSAPFYLTREELDTLIEAATRPPVARAQRYDQDAGLKFTTEWKDPRTGIPVTIQAIRYGDEADPLLYIQTSRGGVTLRQVETDNLVRAWRAASWVGGQPREDHLREFFGDPTDPA